MLTSRTKVVSPCLNATIEDRIDLRGTQAVHLFVGVANHVETILGHFNLPGSFEFRRIFLEEKVSHGGEGAFHHVGQGLAWAANVFPIERAVIHIQAPLAGDLSER